jgi:uncharacterized surface protein with fasciclin (FAS1) repeats
MAVASQLQTKADSLLQIIMSDERLSVLNNLISSSEAVEDLLNPKRLDLTLFAPSDDAFAQLDPMQLEFLRDPKNDETLLQLIELHLVVGTAEIGNLEDTEAFKTVRGDYVAIAGGGGVVHFGPSTVTDMDIAAHNGDYRD